MHNFYEQYQFGSFQCIIKQLLDSVFCHILNNKGFSKCNQSTLIIPGITKTPSNNCLKFASTQIIDGSAITNCRCSQLGCTEIATFWLTLLCNFWLKIRFNQSEVKPSSGQWRVNKMEFLRSSLGRHFAGKPLLASRNVGCFLRLLYAWSFGNRLKPEYWTMCIFFFFTFSYTCSCQDGFFLSIDGHSCSKKKHIQGNNSLRHEHWL